MLSIVWSLLPDNDWWALPVFLCKMNPIKGHWGKGSWPFSFERSAASPPQADHVLVDLFSSVVAGGALQAEPPTQHPHYIHIIDGCTNWERANLLYRNVSCNRADFVLAFTLEHLSCSTNSVTKILGASPKNLHFELIIQANQLNDGKSEK